MRSFNDLREHVKSRVKDLGLKKVVLCGAEDKEALLSVREAFLNDIAEPVLVGNKNTILPLLEELELANINIIHSETDEETAARSVQCVREGNGDYLLKGAIKTSTLLKAVLHKETGIRKEALLSHVLVAELRNQERFLLITDGGMIIRPTLEEKIGIINNAVSVAKGLLGTIPKVACICAVEVVNPSMPETLDAAILAKMNQRGQIKECIIEGPQGIDVALDNYAANTKKIFNDVAGHADILLVPDIHSGNFLGKSAEYFAGHPIGGIVIGAQVPILIVSRADKFESKLNSIVLGASYRIGGQHG
jgi:phosphate butyryltransferase